jgi:hypothetical protein
MSTFTSYTDTLFERVATKAASSKLAALEETVESLLGRGLREDTILREIRSSLSRAWPGLPGHREWAAQQARRLMGMTR